MKRFVTTLLCASAWTAPFTSAQAPSVNTLSMHASAWDRTPADSLALLDVGIQDAYLKASNTDAGDQFGVAVAMDGTTLVVGASREDSDTDGVNGIPFDNSAEDAGAVYVFVRTGPVWTQQAYIKASNSDAEDSFGAAVAIDGDTLVVGATGEDSSATGVGGDESDNSTSASGAVYVFVRSGSVWTQQAYLKASNAQSFDSFGHSVSLSGDTLVVGAPLEQSGSDSVDEGEADNSAPGAGAAYVFTRSGTSWSQQAYLKAVNSDAGDNFGASVAVSGDVLLVGAPGEDSSSPGVGADTLDNTAASAGAAYSFSRSGTTWSFEDYIKPAVPGAADQFGQAVSLAGATFVVGALGEDSDSNTLDAGEADDSAPNAGAVYIFTEVDDDLTQSAYLKAFNSDSNDEFGRAVSLDGDLLVVGARREQGSDDGVGANHLDNSANSAGAAYVFLREEGAWSQVAYVKASNSEAGDFFGSAVTASAEFVVVGSLLEDSAAEGIGGDESDNTAMNAGAAYVLDFSEPAPVAWTNEGSALPGVSGNPLLVGTGSLEPETFASVELFFGAPSAVLAVFAALSSSPVSFKGGTLKPFPIFLVRYANTNPVGGITLPFLLPAGFPTGTELWVQMAIQDGAAVSGVSLSNAIKGTTP